MVSSNALPANYFLFIYNNSHFRNVKINENKYILVRAYFKQSFNLMHRYYAEYDQLNHII